MKMLQDIATKDMAELKRSLRESKDREHEAMERAGRVVPSAYGNRRQRRAAEAVARRKHETA